MKECLNSEASPPTSLRSYREEWEHRRQQTAAHVDVTGLLSIGGALVACTSLGEVMIWEPTRSDVARSICPSNETLSLPLEQTPSRRWKVTTQKLKSIQCYDESENGDFNILIGGEEGLWTISKVRCNNKGADKWKAIVPNVRQILVDRDRVYVLVEIGSIQVYSLSDQHFLYSIDMNGSHASTMALNPPLDTVADDQISDCRYRSLLIGTIDSRILFWSETVDSIMESIHLYPSDSFKSNSPASKLPFEIMVTSIHCSQDQWWTIAGVCRNKKSPPNRCILATLHGPTRTLVSHKETRENIHVIESISSRVYTIANEGVVSIWESPFHLERVQRIWASPPSGRAMVVFNSSQLAVAGVGSKIDIFEHDCRIQSLFV